MTKRPVITEYQDPVTYMGDMIKYRKAEQRAFSVLKVCRELRRCSPALISLILKRERVITPERVEDLSKVMGLTSSERQYFKDWIEKIALGEKFEPVTEKAQAKRKNVSTHLLKDWLNVYVKDAFSLSSIQSDPERIFAFLGGIASRARIEKSIRFLLGNGYLRKTQDGKIVLDTPLAVSDQGLPNSKIRQFHRASLKIARDAVEQYPVDERLANALVVTVDKEEYSELCDIVAEFSEKLKKYSEKKSEKKNEKLGKRLYQVLINLSPTGGKS